MSGIAVITGGGTGIGRAVALKLAEQGWRVVVAGRRAGVLAEAAGLHPNLTPFVADVTVEAEVEALFGHAVARLGRVDLLFNNAGSFPKAMPVEEMPAETFRAALEVNVTGMFLAARAAFRVMAAQAPRGGRIINNGSVSAQVPRPFALAYTVSKHAVTGLTKALSLEGRAHDIACGQIDIGNAATDLSAGFAAGARQADGRMAPEPMMDLEHAASAVLHMASLPLEANVAFMTVMATKMPLVGRG
ncbi:SDR family oxidoreductase [Acidocella sp.]|uniref:SDR family oxidoreductase n=1 Tax=Acidocella sp. TaxID=50710 RepID=UPI0026337B83|nr:SDR family oxidoreductase [Acidocella sp.]